MQSQSKLSEPSIVGTFNIACALTLLGASAAVLAITLSIMGYTELALVALIVAGLADLFDGVLARRLQMGDFEKEFGVQLDTTVEISNISSL